MGLGIQSSSGGGEFKPYVKYDAKAGRMFRNDRTQKADGTWDSAQVDITRGAAFIADFENIRVGWLAYSATGVQRRMAVLGKEAIPPKPTDVGADGKPLFKQGFELTIQLGNSIAGAQGAAARDFSSTAGCVIEAVDALHDAFLAAPESKQGKLPIVRLNDTHPVKSGQSTNYKPDFEIVGWKDRPAEMATETVAAAAAPAPATAAPSTGSTQAPPPAAQQQEPQPALADNDFG